MVLGATLCIHSICPSHGMFQHAWLPECITVLCVLLPVLLCAAAGLLPSAMAIPSATGGASVLQIRSCVVCGLGWVGVWSVLVGFEGAGGRFCVAAQPQHS
jgi:hypothetical protein